MLFGPSKLARFDWIQPWTQVSEADMTQGRIAWFKGGALNVSVNCIDRHLPARAEQTAIIWEGDEPSDDTRISYQQLYQRVCQLANGLRERGIKKGDRVCIYMPMIPEAAYAMLACARIGAIHSVVFGGFSPQSLQDRILDSDCQTVITADEGVRGGRKIPLKDNVDEALRNCPNVHSVITVKRTGNEVPWNADRDVWYDELDRSPSDHRRPRGYGLPRTLFSSSIPLAPQANQRVYNIPALDICCMQQ